MLFISGLILECPLNPCRRSTSLVFKLRGISRITGMHFSFGALPVAIACHQHGPDTQPLLHHYNLSPSSIYLYTPYSLVKSTIALTFSGFASSKNAPLPTIKPPPLPAVSMSFLQ